LLPRPAPEPPAATSVSVAYSNTGYNLLAEAVQRVTGQTFRAWTDERIFRPLGMRDTHFHDDHTRVVRNRADSYRPAADGAGGYHNIVKGGLRQRAHRHDCLAAGPARRQSWRRLPTIRCNRWTS
jgi:CubicO group peptidase (beta-lactamase class C family)